MILLSIYIYNWIGNKFLQLTRLRIATTYNLTIGELGINPNPYFN